MMPLSLANPGEIVTIRKISGNEKVRQHLAELGFVVEAPVKIVSRVSGNLIVQVRESRIAIDKDMAMKIMY